MPRQYPERVAVTCQHCGKTFTVTPARLRARSVRFCGRICWRAWCTANTTGRFWNMVARTQGCWLWSGATDRHGYGVFTFGPRDQRLAHRVAWELTNGPLAVSQCVLHDCDNPICCNPSHLFLGTRLINNQDMVQKNRQAKGTGTRQAKLTEAVVVLMRAEHTQGTPIRQLAKRFHVSPETARAAIQRQTWKHVT